MVCGQALLRSPQEHSSTISHWKPSWLPLLRTSHKARNCLGILGLIPASTCPMLRKLRSKQFPLPLPFPREKLLFSSKSEQKSFLRKPELLFAPSGCRKVKKCRKALNLPHSFGFHLVPFPACTLLIPRRHKFLT